MLHFSKSIFAVLHLYVFLSNTFWLAPLTSINCPQHFKVSNGRFQFSSLKRLGSKTTRFLSTLRRTVLISSSGISKSTYVSPEAKLRCRNVGQHFAQCRRAAVSTRRPVLRGLRKPELEFLFSSTSRLSTRRP